MALGSIYSDDWCVLTQGVQRPSKILENSRELLEWHEESVNGSICGCSTYNLRDLSKRCS
jgi:hypothetical protein